jgi:hypothetical protein
MWTLIQPLPLTLKSSRDNNVLSVATKAQGALVVGSSPSVGDRSGPSLHPHRRKTTMSDMCLWSSAVGNRPKHSLRAGYARLSGILPEYAVASIEEETRTCCISGLRRQGTIPRGLNVLRKEPWYELQSDGRAQQGLLRGCGGTLYLRRTLRETLSGAEARAHFAGFMRGLKSPPPSVSGFSAGCKARRGF